jgi:hypothetical protein
MIDLVTRSIGEWVVRSVEYLRASWARIVKQESRCVEF